MGKTRLVTDLARRAAEAGHRALVGRCSPIDRSSPYRPLAEALLAGARGVPRPGPTTAVGPYVPAVARFVPHWRDQGGEWSSEAPPVVGESLLRVLGWLAGGRGILLVIEDLHWADFDTLAVCEYLIDHVATVPVAVVATARPGEGGGAVAAVVGRSATVRLAPLSDEEVASVVTACIGEAAPETVSRIQRSAGGLPLLVEDLLDAPAAGSPPRFTELVRTRFAALTPATRRALVASALIGDPVELRALDRALGGDGPPQLDEAVDVGLLRREATVVRFRHELTREVVLDLAGDEAGALRPAVAAALEAEGDDERLVQAADLWVAAGAPAQAIRALRGAVARAERQGAPEAVITLFDRVVTLAPDPASRLEAEIQRLAHLVERGRAGAAIPAAMRLLDATAADPPAHAEVRVLAARALLDAGRPDEAEAHLDRVPGALLRADAVVARARVVLMSDREDRRVAAEHLAHQAVALAGDHGVLLCEAFEIIARCARSRSLDEAEAALTRALAAADQHGLLPWRLRLLNELGTVDMLRAADGDRLARAHRSAVEVGALDVAAGVAVNIAALHAMRGELDEAKAAAGRAATAAETLGLRPLQAAAVVIAAVSEGFGGDRPAMERLLARARALAPDDADLDAFAWGAGRGLCALVREERQAARLAFQRAAGTAAPVGTLDTARGPLLLVSAADGDPSEAQARAARAVATPGAGWSDLWLGYGEAALLGAAERGGAASEASEAFAVADEAARRHPLFRAIGLRLVAEAALRDGWGAPVEWLREAEAQFVAGGQTRIAAACRSLLKQAGAPAPRRRGADAAVPAHLLRRGVTAREADVLQLVAERLGNREIGARLYLSPRTVEKHIASLLLKLGARDRRELIDGAGSP
jgi:DNA-binding CsgD family transcriptional regulator